MEITVAGEGEFAMKPAAILSAGEWQDARQKLLVTDRAWTRARDAMGAGEEQPNLVSQTRRSSDAQR